MFVNIIHCGIQHTIPLRSSPVITTQKKQINGTRIIPAFMLLQRRFTDIKEQNYLLKRGSIDTSTVKAVFTLLSGLYRGPIRFLFVKNKSNNNNVPFFHENEK